MPIQNAKGHAWRASELDVPADAGCATGIGITRFGMPKVKKL
jgi:hypothetical protein